MSCSLVRRQCHMQFRNLMIGVISLFLLSGCHLLGNPNPSGNAWTSPTHSIVFKSNRDVWMRDRVAEIWVVGETGKQILPIPNSTMGDPWLSAPAWSHDGRRLIFAVLTNAGTGLALLSAEATDYALLVDSASSGDWSPDDMQIVYYSYATRSINLFDLKTKLSRLVVSDLPKLFEEDPRFSWALYDDWIAFDMPNSDGTWSIYILDLKSGEVRHLIDGRYPDFAPARQEIAYVLGERIRRLDLQTMQSYTVVDAIDQKIAWPSWSSDGEKLVYSQNLKPGVWNLYTVNRNGSDITQITSGDFADIAPDWRPTAP